jgi:peptidoglycan hydrolase-like protein with peptidoglycan-binding domain
MEHSMNRLILATASAFLLSGVVAAHAAGQGSMSGQTSTQPSYGMSGSSQSGAAMVSQSEIKQAQQQLKQDGYYQGAVDGIAGPETKQAISKYQRAQGLQETATLDQHTLQSLTGGRTTGSGSSASPSGSSGMGGSSSMQRGHSSGSNGSAGAGTSSKQ